MKSTTGFAMSYRWSVYVKVMTHLKVFFRK